MGPETLEACYQTLGLTPDAKYYEIKHAYRTLVKRWHPDRFATDLDRQRQALEHFHAVTHAYAMLRAHRTATDLSRLHGHWWHQGVRTLSWTARGAWCLGIGVLIVVGCYAFQPTCRHTAPSASSARLPGDLAQSVSPRAYVTVGSTHAAVRAIQGTPTWATDRIWEYGGSRLYFKAGRVIGWDIWPSFPLNVQLLPAASINPVPASFTVGSTKDEVLAVQGTPTRVTERLWEYGASRVFFTDNRVTRWEVWPGSPLHARLLPVAPET
jgi:DnaJ domain